MLAEVLVGTMAVVGMASALSTLVFWRKNGNGKPERDPWHVPEAQPATSIPPAKLEPVEVQPVQVQWPPELAALLTHITERLESAIERVEHPLVVRDPAEPVWAAQVVQDLERIHDRMSEPATAMLPPELTAGLDRVTDRLEHLLETPPPAPPNLDPVVDRLEKLVASMPQPQPDLAAELAALPRKISELLAAARRDRTPPPVQAKPPGNGGANPPKSAPARNLPRLDPNEQPAVPSIPAPYVPGTVTVPAGQVWSLLYLIQKQLSPNCPGSSVEFSLSTDDEVLVGGASLIGGPLSETNYAYKLTPDNSPRTYRATYPGGNTPVGELQVLATAGGTLHVEVQS